MRRAAVLALLLAPAAAEDELSKIRTLITRLGASDPDVRYGAAQELAAFGPRAKIAVPALAKLLGDEEYAIPEQAADAIKKVGPDGVPALVKALGSEDGEVRARVAALLEEDFFRELDPHLRTLAASLKDENRRAREGIARALARQGEPGIALLVSAFLAREPQAHDAAVVGLVAAGTMAVEPVREALGAANERMRAGAARALGAMRAQAAAENLLAALDDKSPDVRGAAARALGEIGYLPRQAAPRLVEGLRDENGVVREGCIDGLAAFGELASDVLVATLAVDEVRPAASEALFRMGERSFPILGRALEHESPAVRRATLAILQRFNPISLPTETLGAALRCLRDEDGSVRTAAARVGEAAAPRVTPDWLTRVVKDKDPAVRAAAIAALGEIGTLPELPADADAVVRVEAILAGWKVRGGAGAEELHKLAGDETQETRVRVAAVEALGRMGLGAEGVDLCPLVAAGPVEVRRAAARALGELTLPSARAIREARASAKLDAEVEAGLAWLAKAQRPDGAWALGTLTTGGTGLALLAFLGAGCGPQHDRFGATVRSGLGFLTLQRDGARIGSSDPHEYLLCHGLATMAFVEAWLLGGNYGCRRTAQAGLDYLAWARGSGLGWRYGARSGASDTHVTTWLLTTLRIADAAGLRVDRDAYAGAAQWIEQMTGASGRTGYNYPGGAGARPEGRQETFPVDSVEPMTAAAIWCRQLLGGDALGSPLHRKAIGIVLARPPSTRANERDQIYWHFGALALFHDSDGSYRKWEKALEPALSVMRDRESGAWNALGVWARDLDDKDRVYPTATAVLTLLTPTRYPRDFLTKPKLSAADRAAIAALKKALRDEDARVQEIAAAALARLP